MFGICFQHTLGIYYTVVFSYVLVIPFSLNQATESRTPPGC